MNNKRVNQATVYVNLSKAQLIEHAVIRGEGVLSETGALITNTKKYTGRSPDDKFSVEDDFTKNLVWFNAINKKMMPEHAQSLYEKVANYLAERTHYVLHCQVGAGKNHTL